MSNYNVITFVEALQKAREANAGKNSSVKYLTAAQLVQRWDGSIQKGTLSNWRSQGKGPPFVKMGSRVLYPIAKLEAWEEKRLRNVNDNEPDTEAIEK